MFNIQRATSKAEITSKSTFLKHLIISLFEVGLSFYIKKTPLEWTVNLLVLYALRADVTGLDYRITLLSFLLSWADQNSFTTIE